MNGKTYKIMIQFGFYSCEVQAPYIDLLSVYMTVLECSLSMKYIIFKKGKYCKMTTHPKNPQSLAESDN